MGPLLIETFRYHKWANLHLMDVCAKLSEDQLQLTAPGTYGTIAATLQHLVAAEQRYILVRLDGGKATLNERVEFPGVVALRQLAASGGDRLIAAAGKIKPDDATEASYDGARFKLLLGVVLIQALHHGNDHRTHVCTILGSHGIPYGDMDVWAYGEATGAMVPIPAGG
jgi:uncharacterized damage-inducible protein DinB